MPYLTREEDEEASISCKVLTAALDLFVEKGYHNVSIHDVQKTAGVSIGSIYNHFGGKEGVAQALYDHLVEELERVLLDVKLNAESPEQQCRDAIVRLFALTETHRNIMAFIFNVRHGEILDNRPTIASSAAFVQVRGMVSDAMQEGRFRTMNPMVAASLVFGSAIRMIQLRLDGVITDPLPKLQDELIESVWLAVESKGDSPECDLSAVASG